jgi:hypothetical protein
MNFAVKYECMNDDLMKRIYRAVAAEKRQQSDRCTDGITISKFKFQNLKHSILTFIPFVS